MKNQILFELTDEYIELCHLLKITGVICSGGEAKHAITTGLVAVDGQIELRKKCKIRAGQSVKFEATIIQVK